MILYFLFLLLLVAFLYQRYRQMTILKRNGIPGPTPNFIYGNMFSIRKKPNVILFNEYFAKYGKIMGYYMVCIHPQSMFGYKANSICLINPTGQKTSCSCERH